MRIIGYVRVSTEEQAQDGVSLTIQRDRVTAYCELHGLDLVAIEADEGVSAKSLNRPALKRALDRLRAGEADGMVITKLDRLSRSVADWAALIDGYFGERGGRHLASVGDSIDTRSAAGRLVLNVIMSVAQWEREKLSEQVGEAMAYLKRKGMSTGQVPYGMRLANPSDPDDGRLEIHPDEEPIRREIVAMRADGLSARKIARLLTARGVPTKTRKSETWEAGSVRSILRRARES